MSDIEPDRSLRGKDLDVGILIHGWPPHSIGGVESHSRMLAHELRARGHRVHVLAMDTREGGEPYSTFDEVVEGVPVRRMAYRYHDLGALADLVNNRRASEVLRSWLGETPCDIVHVQHVTGWGMSAIEVVAEKKLPTVMTLHDYWPLCPRGQMLRNDRVLCSVAEPDTCARCIASTWWWASFLPSQGGRNEGPDGSPVATNVAAARARSEYASRCLTQVHRLLSPSSATREIYVRHGIPPEQVVVCENGVAGRELSAAVAKERKQATPRRGVHLGVLGSVQPSKGAVELARVVDSIGLPDLWLHIHGGLADYHGDSSYVSELRELAAANAKIVIHGPYTREGLPGVLAALDGVAAPARWEEVYGHVAFEARAAGLPVLVSTRGGLPAAAQGGEAGRVLPADDAEAWREALIEFTTNPKLRNRWANAASTVREERDMVAEIETIYWEAIEFATRGPP